MISLHNIRTVARYEAKTLRRSWLFRLFSLGSLIIITIMNLSVFSPIGGEDWESLAIPSTLPLINLYLLNIAQALVIIFLASDFLKSDKKLDTNEVLYTRSMSNFEYILGKTLGILKLFLGLNLIILFICLVINIISQQASVDILSYFEYLLIISLPTLIFSLGFTYILMSLIKNQAITFLLLLGYAALNMFYFFHRAGSLFDYMLFGMPVFKSQLIGFHRLDMIVAHRLLYTFLGLGFILITTLIFKRLPQSKTHRGISLLFVAFFFTGAVFSAKYFWNEYNNDQKLKAETIETNRRYEKKDFINVSTASLELTHSGKQIKVVANLKCLNPFDHNVETILFSLNPGLEVSSVQINNSSADYETDNHILLIDQSSPLSPGSSVDIRIEYEGSINEAYCYPWYTDDIKENSYIIGPVRVAKQQAYISDDYLILTPETHWYPYAGLNYYPGNPARIKVDFSRFNLKVNNSDGLIPVSQGKMTTEGDYYIFNNDDPLTGITLVAGNYTSQSITVDSVEYIAYYYPGHDYYKNDLNEISDTLASLISGVMTELETNFSTQYPFSRLSLVEVPIQFHSVEKKNTQTRAEVQASMILVPEKLAIIRDAGFYRVIKRQKRRMERSNQVVTDKELQVRAFNTFVRNTFISSSNFNFRGGEAVNTPGRYLLGPSYYFFKNNFYSNDYPVINAVFESHLQKVENPRGNMSRFFLGGLSENDKANTILHNTNLRDVLALNPSNDTTRIILTVKGDYLFNLLRSEAGINEFNAWFVNYLEDNKFKNIEINDFSDAVSEEFAFNLKPFLKEWYEGSGQPGFLFSNVEAREIIVGNRTRYKVSFIASNPENTPGLFNVTFRSGGRGGGMGGGRGSGGSVNITVSSGGRSSISIGGSGRGMQANEIEKIVKLDAMQAKSISIILDAQPRMMIINTLSSINNPGELNFPLMDLIEDKKTDDNEGEQILDHIPLLYEENEIVVDNEDPGFKIYQPTTSSRLKEWLNIKGRDGNDYREMFIWWAPEYWQKTVQSNNFGKYVKSAVYTRGGAGERHISWTAEIKDAAYYDVYTYIAKRGNRMTMNRGGRDGRSRNTMQDMHFEVEHDDGTEEVTLDWENAENGWNHLGSYYLSPDSATVILTNTTSGRTISGDAIKWTKQNSYK